MRAYATLQSRPAAREERKQGPSACRVYPPYDVLWVGQRAIGSQRGWPMVVKLSPTRTFRVRSSTTPTCDVRDPLDTKSYNANSFRCIMATNTENLPRARMAWLLLAQHATDTQVKGGRKAEEGKARSPLVPPGRRRPSARERCVGGERKRERGGDGCSWTGPLKRRHYSIPPREHVSAHLRFGSASSQPSRLFRHAPSPLPALRKAFWDWLCSLRYSGHLLQK